MDDTATPLVRESIDYPESGRLVRIRVWQVPESEAYPNGIKYSFHYGDTDGNTILRYDNSHADRKGHERHTADGIDESYEFPGEFRTLLQRFRTEVDTYEHE